jgi:hypothetical protein
MMLTGRDRADDFTDWLGNAGYSRTLPWGSADVSLEDVKDREQRRDRKVKGFARRSGGGVEPAIFDNVSDKGCCIRGDFRIGEWLVVTVPTLGTVQAQVRWSIGGRAGLRIDGGC